MGTIPSNGFFATFRSRFAGQRYYVVYHGKAMGRDLLSGTGYNPEPGGITWVGHCVDGMAYKIITPQPALGEGLRAWAKD